VQINDFSIPLHPQAVSPDAERILLQRAIGYSQNGITIGRLENGRYPLIYANPAFYRLTGYSPEDIIGKDCRLLQGLMNDQPDMLPLRAALASLANGDEATVQLLNSRKNGTIFWSELTLSPVFDESGTLTHYVGVQSDITQRVNDAQAIAALNQSLTQRGSELGLANESLRSFSSSVSHDLRAPLASIRGFSTLLKKSIELPNGSLPAHYMSRIEANVDRMSQLMDALLKLAESTANELNICACDLSSMAQEVVDASRITWPDLQTPVHIESGMSALGDRTLLYSVMENLICNALKYSSRTKAATVHIGSEITANGQTRFFVRDNGAGFDMKAATTLFGTFQRFHSETEFAGTGVGLATVQRIVARHGGTICAESAPGKGAVFYFTLAASNATGLRTN